MLILLYLYLSAWEEGVSDPLFMLKGLCGKELVINFFLFGKCCSCSLQRLTTPRLVSAN